MSIDMHTTTAIALAGSLLLAVACSSSSSGGGAGGNGAGGSSGGVGGDLDLEGPCEAYDNGDDCRNDAEMRCTWGAVLRAPDATSCEYDVLEERCIWFSPFVLKTAIGTGTDTGSSEGIPACNPNLEGGVHYYRETAAGVDLWGSCGDAPPKGSTFDTGSPDWKKCEDGSPELCTCACE